MVRVWLSVNLKRHGVDCGGTVGRIGPWARADRSQTWPGEQAQEAKNAELHKIDRGDIPPLRIAVLYAAGNA
jgi:hypothetical protein